MQRGSQDCSLFAIAFATALCLGKQPGRLCFDQDRMCTHLLKCIESQEMTMFPVRSEERERDERLAIISSFLHLQVDFRFT